MEKFGSGIRDKHPGSGTLNIKPRCWAKIVKKIPQKNKISRYRLFTVKSAESEIYWRHMQRETIGMPYIMMVRGEGETHTYQDN
jgi:hypothetical protein